MHDRRRAGSPAVWAASTSSQPDIDPPTTPADESPNHSRREIGEVHMLGLLVGPLMVEQELARIQQCPENIGQRRGGVVSRTARIDISDQPLGFVGAGTAAERGQIKGFNAPGGV